jgi:Skp family chaperone for outer membrane proteins
MKKISWVIIFIGMTLSGSAEEIYAYVNLQEVFQNFYKTELAQDQIQQQADELQLEQELMNEEIEEVQSRVEAYRADARDQSLSDEMRRNKRILLEEQLIELQRAENELVEYGKLRSSQIEDQNKRMTKRIFDEIQQEIVRYAKLHNLASVVDRSAKSQIGTDIVMFVDNEVDISAAVLDELNKGREKILPMEDDDEEDSAE